MALLIPGQSAPAESTPIRVFISNLRKGIKNTAILRLVKNDTAMAGPCQDKRFRHLPFTARIFQLPGAERIGYEFVTGKLDALFGFRERFAGSGLQPVISFPGASWTHSPA
jgi:hypothetical protein